MSECSSIQSLRFDYVKYDETSQAEQAKVRDLVEGLERAINGLLPGRAQCLALTKLEECYMWCGKAIRDDQVMRAVQADNNENKLQKALRPFKANETNEDIMRARPLLHAFNNLLEYAEALDARLGHLEKASGATDTDTHSGAAIT